MTSIQAGDLTPEAFHGDLTELGWRGHFQRDDPPVVALRDQLIANAGLPDIELVDPSVPGYAQRAAQLLERDGVRQQPAPAPEMLPSAARLTRGAWCSTWW